MLSHHGIFLISQQFSLSLSLPIMVYNGISQLYLHFQYSLSQNFTVFSLCYHCQSLSNQINYLQSLLSHIVQQLAITTSILYVVACSLWSFTTLFSDSLSVSSISDVKAPLFSTPSISRPATACFM